MERSNGLDYDSWQSSGTTWCYPLKLTSDVNGVDDVVFAVRVLHVASVVATVRVLDISDMKGTFFVHLKISGMWK